MIDDLLSGERFQVLGFQDKNRCLSCLISASRIVECDARFGLSTATRPQCATDRTRPKAEDCDVLNGQVQTATDDRLVSSAIL
jgi:hypothetical protein